MNSHFMAMNIRKIQRSILLFVLLLFLLLLASQLAFYARSSWLSRGPSVQTEVEQKRVQVVGGDSEGGTSTPEAYAEQPSLCIKLGDQSTPKTSVNVQVETVAHQGAPKGHVELTSTSTKLANLKIPDVSVRLTAGYQGTPKGYIELRNTSKNIASSPASKNNSFEQPSVQLGDQPGPNTTTKGYVFALYYYDQQTACVRNLLSLQCWAARFGFKIVEPFVVNTFFGVPLQRLLYGAGNFLRFSDIYDSQEWNNNYMKPHSFPAFATWEEFLNNAPRDVILVSTPLRQKNCNFSKMFGSCSSFLKRNGFTVIRKVCLPVWSSSVLSFNEVDHQILPLQIAEVTVIFEEWKGFVVPGQENAPHGIKVRKPCKCSRRQVLPPMTELNVSANPTIKRHAQRYIQDVLNGQDYIAIMIRFEYMWNENFNIDSCIQQTLNSWNAVRHQMGVNTTFLTWDIGKLGSATLGSQRNEKLKSKAVSLFRALYANSSTTSIKDWEEKFVEFSGTSHPAYIAMLQKTIVANARCLILAGGGTYQQHSLALYQAIHGSTEWCYEIIRKRRMERHIVTPSSI